MQLAPVVLFAYKRKDKLRDCLQALDNNFAVESTELFIFSDGAKSENDIKQVQEVRSFIEDYKGMSNFKKVTVFFQPINKGLANSIINGVTQVICEFEKVIVVEDDLIVAKDFLRYMNQALDFYQNFKEYGSISGYTYPLAMLKSYDKDIYVTRKGECWGWGTWKDRWIKVDWSVKDFKKYLQDKKKRKSFNELQHGIDKMLIMQMQGKIDSWAVRWCFYLFNNELLTVYPRESKTKNTGFDGSGTHCTDTNIYEIKIENNCLDCKFARLKVNESLEKEAAKFEDRSIADIVWNRVRRIFK